MSGRHAPLSSDGQRLGDGAFQANFAEGFAPKLKTGTATVMGRNKDVLLERSPPFRGPHEPNRNHSGTNLYFK